MNNRKIMNKKMISFIMIFIVVLEVASPFMGSIQIDAKGVNETEEKNLVSDPSDTILTKTVTDENANGIAEENEILHYTYVVENNSDEIYTNVVIKDDLTAEVDLDITSSTLSTYVTLTNKAGSSVYDTHTIGDLIEGFSLGDLAPNDSITVQFDLRTKSDLTQVNGINSKAELTMNNTADTILETRNSTTGDYKDQNPDIIQAETIDPFTGVEFTKIVEDANNNGTAEVGETLHYEYLITNTSSTTLRNVRLKDDLSIEQDLNETDLNAVNVEIQGSNTLTTATLADLQATLKLGALKPGHQIRVNFNIAANSIFTETNGINSKAEVRVANTPEVIRESVDTTTNAYKDQNPDIEQNNIQSDILDNVTHKLCYTFDTINPDMDCDHNDLSRVEAGYYLVYEINIDNTEGDADEELVFSRGSRPDADASTDGIGDGLGVYEIASHSDWYKSIDGGEFTKLSSPLETVVVPAGSQVTIQYCDKAISPLADDLDIKNQLTVTDLKTGAAKDLTVYVDKRITTQHETLEVDSIYINQSTAQDIFNRYLEMTPDEIKAAVINDVNLTYSGGPIDPTDVTLTNGYVPGYDTLINWLGYKEDFTDYSLFPEKGFYQIRFTYNAPSGNTLNAYSNVAVSA